MTRTLSSLAAGLALGAGAATAAGQVTTYLTEFGHFHADGSVAFPHSLLGAAVCSAPPAATISIGPGLRFDTGVFSNDVTLAPTSSPVVIFGDAVPTLPAGWPLMPDPVQWLDDERAPLIGNALAAEGVDIAGVNEAWDPDLATAIIDHAAFAHGFYANFREAFCLPVLGCLPPAMCLNSGLLLMSEFPVEGPVQVPYQDEAGLFESIATKSYVRATIHKDGFGVGIFLTHTQAGDTAESLAARAGQLNQLAAAIQLYRSINPSHAVIAMGDFNVIGGATEYMTTMTSLLGVVTPTRDIAHNLACMGAWLACTSCTSNQFNLFFNPSATNKRLDYFLYAHSLDGTVRVVPKDYEIRDYQVPPQFPPLSANGLTTRELSDHYGIYAEFKLVR
jgi:hypothetical protein